MPFYCICELGFCIYFTIIAEKIARFVHLHQHEALGAVFR